MATALIFPGQGAQAKNMGRDLAEASRECMELWKLAEKASGLPLREVYFESQDEALMAETRYLQPALTVVNLSLWLHISPKCKPACAAGHSLGEFAALGAAEVLSLPQIMELVSLRGQLMSEATHGAMAAVLKLKRPAVEQIVSQIASQGHVLTLANYNTPEQFVLSGTQEALDLAAPLIKEQKGRLMPLAVSGAFHSPLMQPAAKALSQALDKYTWRKPKFPIYSNVTAKPITDGESLRQLCKQHMISSVLWIDTITNQHHNGITTWLELGPKSVLGKMITQILAEPHTIHLATLEHCCCFE